MSLKNDLNIQGKADNDERVIITTSTALVSEVIP